MTSNPQPPHAKPSQMTDIEFLRELKDARWNVPEIRTMNERLERIAQSLETSAEPVNAPQDSSVSQTRLIETLDSLILHPPFSLMKNEKLDKYCIGILHDCRAAIATERGHAARECDARANRQLANLKAVYEEENARLREIVENLWPFVQSAVNDQLHGTHAQLGQLWVDEARKALAGAPPIEQVTDAKAEEGEG